MILKRISKLTFDKDIKEENDYLNLFVGKPGNNAMCINFFNYYFSDEIRDSNKLNHFKLIKKLFYFDVAQINPTFIELNPKIFS